MDNPQPLSGALPPTTRNGPQALASVAATNQASTGLPSTLPTVPLTAPSTVPSTARAARALVGQSSSSRASAGQNVASAFEGFAVSTGFSLIDDVLTIAWGLYSQQTGEPVFADSQFGIIHYHFSYNGQSNIANAPLEGGDFVSYNKHVLPRQHQVGVSCSGTEAQRSRFFQVLDGLRGSTELLFLQMPEASFTNLSVVNISWQRTAQSGTQLVNAMLTLQEVRLYATTNGQNTKTGLQMAPLDRGSVGAVQPSIAQQHVIGQGALGSSSFGQGLGGLLA
ncbi:hypothetical protein [Entomobacter blattae]|uniref:Uncharacterized protein n=1 Tax=Entomobacter blattae TaxID=2762277 RepID=A0A7H1NR75_9PROT|nr:hypothetical protein [Entomobacter blattae]QNT78285.1 hypothetical protein JGUZn3_10570 [Entomobacter blattae]